jgi:hypothetical protein
VAFSAWIVWGPHGKPAASPLFVALPAPAEIDFHISGSFPGLPEISPDGRRVAFSGEAEGDNRVLLYVRALDADRAVPLGDTRDAQYPFWSADGNGWPTTRATKA